MRRLLPVLLLAGLLSSGPIVAGSPFEALQHRSVSRSHQFLVYADDPNARSAIAMDAEDVKDKFLQLLDTTDTWKGPIVIQLTPQDTATAAQPSCNVRILDTEDGFKVELNIVLGSDPREMHFPQQLVRALLLEYAYRNQQKLVAPGTMYAEPPPWLVDGIASIAADPDPDANAGLFRSLILSGKTPTLAMFLSENPATLDDPSRHLYSACAMSLVRLLTEMPNGHVLMQGFIRNWPGGNADPAAELLKAFPELDEGGQSLEKWWTLGLASLSASDRYQGLSLEETCQDLDAALKFDVAIDKAGKTKSFALGDYALYHKAPGATAALNNLSVQLLGLEAHANPLMRDVIGAYQGIAVQLAHHESHHLKAHLAALAEYRSRLTEHMDQIADYLNWYEATQRTQASGSFDEYIRTADELDKEEEAPKTDPISRYLDSVEQELSQ